MQVELPRCFYARRHVGEAEIHRLVLDDGFAESRALTCVFYRCVECGLCHSDRLRGDIDPPGFEVCKRDAVTLAFAS